MCCPFLHHEQESNFKNKKVLFLLLHTLSSVPCGSLTRQASTQKGVVVDARTLHGPSCPGLVRQHPL